MGVNFKPEQNNYNGIGAFRFWCQKVIPLVYEDTMSYYELLSRVVEYLNKTIEHVDLMGEDMQKLYEAYGKLQEYINNYFDNLSVQHEVNVKLDIMAHDGSLSRLIQPLFDEYKRQIDETIEAQNDYLEESVEEHQRYLDESFGAQNKSMAYMKQVCDEQRGEIDALKGRVNSFTHLGAGSTTGDAELIDARVGADGVTYANVGEAMRTQIGAVASEIDKLPTYYGMIRTENIFNYLNATRYQELKTDGSIVERKDEQYWNTGFIDVAGCSTISTTHICNKVCFYDENKAFISIATDWVKFYNVPNNAKYMVIQFATNKCNYYDACYLTILTNMTTSKDIPYVPYYKADDTDLKELKGDFDDMKGEFQVVNANFADVVADFNDLNAKFDNVPSYYGMERTENIFNYLKCNFYEQLNVDGSTVERLDGQYWNTGFIDITDCTYISTTHVCNRLCYYDENKVFMSTDTKWLKYYKTVPNAKYVVIQFSKKKCDYDSVPFVSVIPNMPDSSDIAYVPYYKSNVSDLKKVNEGLEEVNEELVRLDEMMKNETSGKLADYIVQEIKTVSTAHAKKNGTFKFAFETDIHDRKFDAIHKYSILNEFAKTGFLDAVVCGGDCQGASSKDVLFDSFQKYNSVVTNGINIPYFLCKGNHEAYGGEYSEADMSNVLNAQEWFSIGCKSQGVPVVFDKDNVLGGYYYYDFDVHKIRMIVLNTSENYNLDKYFDPCNVIIRQTQIDWLCNKALNFMDKSDRNEWSVIIVSHAAINKNESGGLGGQVVIEGILNAFMNGSTYVGSQHAETSVHHVTANCDFTEQGKMDFICNICGHMHYDRVTYFSDLRRPCISVGSATIDNSPVSSDTPDATRPIRTAGDITAELLDLVSIDPKERKIYLTRFGAGEDREVSY